MKVSQETRPVKVSKSSRQCDLSYLLTYSSPGRTESAIQNAKQKQLHQINIQQDTRKNCATYRGNKRTTRQNEMTAFAKKRSRGSLQVRMRQLPHSVHCSRSSV